MGCILGSVDSLHEIEVQIAARQDGQIYNLS